MIACMMRLFVKCLKHTGNFQEEEDPNAYTSGESEDEIRDNFR
jgi:hypothetical protein